MRRGRFLGSSFETHRAAVNDYSRGLTDYLRRLADDLRRGRCVDGLRHLGLARELLGGALAEGHAAGVDLPRLDDLIRRTATLQRFLRVRCVGSTALQYGHAATTGRATRRELQRESVYHSAMAVRMDQLLQQGAGSDRDGDITPDEVREIQRRTGLEGARRRNGRR